VGAALQREAAGKEKSWWLIKREEEEIICWTAKDSQALQVHFRETL
jgi:hypothetical protein